jgi:hypothetical protein
MDLKAYFDKTDGMGILSTADTEGNVNSALYARPHVQPDGTIAFIMQPRLSYANLQTNPKAVYLFIEKTPGHQGRRLYLEKINEETDPAKIQAARRSTHGSSENSERARFVFFRVTHTRPLVGDVEEE